MTQRTRTLVTFGMASAMMLALGLSGAQANDYGYGKEGHAGGGHSAMGGHGMGMMHSSTGHLIRHLLKHEKEIGLTGDQVAKLKEMQLNLDKTRIKSEADIQVAERELRSLLEDEKSDLSAVEAKLKQSEDLQIGLRMASFKARRDVLALLTPEQRAKEKAEHEKMMQQHKDKGKGHGTAPHGTAPHGASPHGGNPHKGTGSTAPAAPGTMSVQ
jgi:Spy/CpxP family protein refolding chaperone